MVTQEHSLSLEQVALKFGPMLRRIARAHEADPWHAEELAQETLLAIWRAMPAYRGDAPLQGFIARIAMNVAVDHIRRALRRRRPEELSLDIADPADGPELQAVAADERTRLMAAVRHLPLAHRQAALLMLEGLSVADIANALGISTNAVSVRLLRAKQLLREKLGESR